MGGGYKPTMSRRRLRMPLARKVNILASTKVQVKAI